MSSLHMAMLELLICSLGDSGENPEQDGSAWTAAEGGTCKDHRLSSGAEFFSTWVSYLLVSDIPLKLLWTEPKAEKLLFQ